MNYTDEKQLLDRYRKGLCTSEETLTVEHWFNQHAKVSVSNDSVYDHVGTEMWDNIEANIGHKKPTYKLWPRIAIAAAVVGIVFGVWLFTSREQGAKNKALVVSKITNDIAPGKNGATLTLANSQKILINDALTGNIASQSGVKIFKNANGQLVYEITDDNSGELKYNTLSTTRGEQAQVRLPDGTLVFLNAESSLNYPTSFAKTDKRRVTLNGEAYFEVAKDKKHPFVVKSRSQEVEVLGTHFNIKDYEEEPFVSTTLVEGSVRINAGENTNLLKPGQESRYNGASLAIEKADVESNLDWKKGDFVFKKIDFRLAMRKIERWYDIEFIYENPIQADLEVGGWISRSSKLSEVLKLIESSGAANFKVIGRKVYVTN
ncbi:fec operon regulator FecR [compost metagenome]